MYLGVAAGIEDGSNGCTAIDQYNMFKVQYGSFSNMTIFFGQIEIGFYPKQVC